MPSTSATPLFGNCSWIVGSAATGTAFCAETLAAAHQQATAHCKREEKRVGMFTSREWAAGSRAGNIYLSIDSAAAFAGDAFGEGAASGAVGFARGRASSKARCTNSRRRASLAVG